MLWTCIALHVQFLRVLLQVLVLQATMPILLLATHSFLTHDGELDTSFVLHDSNNCVHHMHPVTKNAIHIHHTFAPLQVSIMLYHTTILS